MVFLPGDRVRVTKANRAAGYQPGDKGTFLRADRTFTGECYYLVTMDKDGSTVLRIAFTEGEIEPDV